MKRGGTFLAILILLGSITAPVIASTPTPAAATITTQQEIDEPEHLTRVLLYGDSLGSESEQHFVDAITRHQRAEVRTGVYGGTAICDWLERMHSDAAWSPDAVVIEFSGNALTPCMQHAVGEDYWQKYRSDAEAVISTFPTARVYLIATPINRTQATHRDLDTGRLNRIYATIARTYPQVQYVPADEAVLRQDDYTETLPCLVAEPCAGDTSLDGTPQNQVRAPDGAHFCPEPPAPAVNGVTSTCLVWSSGAYRFGHAMAASVVDDFAL